MVADLAAWYRREQAAWKAAPLAAEVRRRLKRARRAAAVFAEALGELRPADVALLGWPRRNVAEHLEAVDQVAADLTNAIADLDARGAGRGGARRVRALFMPPPRFRLAVRVAEQLEMAGMQLGSAERGSLHDAVLAVLHDVGEDGRGLPDVLRDVIAARRRANRPAPLPVHPCQVRHSSNTVLS